MCFGARNNIFCAITHIARTTAAAICEQIFCGLYVLHTLIYTSRCIHFLKQYYTHYVLNYYNVCV